MNWNKLKKQLEGFLAPSLLDRVTYLPSGYRYVKDRKNMNCITVDNDEVFNVKKEYVQWFEHEQDVKSNFNMIISISNDDLIRTRKQVGNQVPDERLSIIAEKNLKAEYTKKIIDAQVELFKTDFHKCVSRYTSMAIEDCLYSDQILLNVLAIMDKRVGKKRLQKMRDDIRLKHPIVQYFYQLRIS